jgi:hypothetical protein
VGQALGTAMRKEERIVNKARALLAITANAGMMGFLSYFVLFSLFSVLSYRLHSPQ